MRVRKFSIRFLLVAVAVLAFSLAIVTHPFRIASELRASDPNIDLYYRYQYENYDDVDHYSLNHDATLDPLLNYVGPDFVSTIVKVSSQEADEPAEIAKLSSRLPNLRQLAIQDTPLKDVDLIPLVSLTQLRGLYLRGTAITDESVPTLRQIQSLRVLNIRNTSLSESAISQLRTALPNTRVHSGPASGGIF